MDVARDADLPLSPFVPAGSSLASGFGTRRPRTHRARAQVFEPCDGIGAEFADHLLPPQGVRPLPAAELFRSVGWSSGENPDELVVAMRNSHRVVSAKRPGRETPVEAAELFALAALAAAILFGLAALIGSVGYVISVARRLPVA